MKPSPPAIKGPLARAETASATPRRVIPDGCNMGVLLRVIAIVVALSLTAAVAESSGPTDIMANFLRLMSLAAPDTLTTLMLWCAERRALPALGVVVQRTVAWLTPGLVAYVFLSGEAIRSRSKLPCADP